MKKKYVISLIIVASLAAAILIYLQTRKLRDFEPQIIAKLQSLVLKGTDSLYRLSIERIEVDVVKARIGLVNTSLAVDSSVLTKMESAESAPDDIFRISLQSLYIDGLDPADLLDTKSIHLNQLNIENPTIEIFHKKRKYNSEKRKDTTSLHKKLADQINSFSLDTLFIKGAGFIHHNLAVTDKKSELKDVSIHFNKILIDATTEYDTTRFLFAKEALISLKDYSYRTSDGSYFLKADAVSISAPKNMMEISGFSLKPAMSRTAFDKATGFRKEQYDITVKNIGINQINWWDLVNDDGLTADTMKISDSRVKVYMNRSLPAPPKSKVGSFPHQLLMKLKLPVKIDRIRVSRLDLDYEEFNPKSGKTAGISFNNTSGTISNITNQAVDIRKDQYMRVSAESFFMHDAPLKSDFIFDLAHYKEGKFHVDMELKKIDKEQLEKVANGLGLFSIKSLNIKSLKAQVDGNDKLGKGTVLLLYDDLKIVPLKKDGDSKSGMKQRNFLGFVINSFVLKDNNPSDDEKPRNPTGQFVRETDKSFFNLVWKTILVGILETVGANPKLAKSK
jgi:hypothetical protein